MEVIAVTHRKDAIFHTIVGGGLEHQLLGAIPKEATLLTHLRRNFPNVLDVHLSPGGVMRFHLYVKIKKRQEGEAKNVMMGAFAASFDLKHVIVVDDDVDIHNPTEVEWAVATRFQADRDLLIVPESQGSKLDPSNRDGVGAKMGIDATKPLTRREMTFKRIRVPGEEAIDVADMLKRAAQLADVSRDSRHSGRAPKREPGIHSNGTPASRIPAHALRASGMTRKVGVIHGHRSARRRRRGEGGVRPLREGAGHQRRRRARRDVPRRSAHHPLRHGGNPLRPRTRSRRSARRARRSDWRAPSRGPSSPPTAATLRSPRRCFTAPACPARSAGRCRPGCASRRAGGWSPPMSA